MTTTFPDDANGAVLRGMAESGDDLSKARDIDFVVVLPSESSARVFAEHFAKEGYMTRIENAGTAPELPWDVTIVRRMVPTHADITAFEEALERTASRLGGRNDGWGSFQQQAHVH